MNQRLIPILAIVWLTLVTAGTVALAVYDDLPGASEVEKTGEGMWPRESRIPRPKGRDLLLMFVHPKCPCSRAGMSELAVLMADCQGKADVLVVFYRPEGTDKNWEHTDLWTSAASIPGVSVRDDEGGTEARVFGAKTSGQVILYDGAGKVLYSGGMTISRGHEGNNSGRMALEDLIKHGVTSQKRIPPFGCSLTNPG